MNETNNPFPGDLLSSLAANPELLKNAMQMASALASSGMLNGLFGGTEDSSSPPSTQQGGPSGQIGGITDLLAGLMGKSASGNPPPSASQTEHCPPIEKKQQDASSHPIEPRRTPSPNHNDRIHLLQSICPFLSEEKREKVQFLIKLLGLLSAAEQMGLGTGKLF